MQRYVVDYTNGHDLAVCDEIMSPAYRIQIGGDVLDLSEYKAMVGKAFERFPDLALTVHEISWSGRRVAMRFSESATSPRHGDARAVWPGIALYRLDEGGRLASCAVEQDFYGRHEQLVSRSPAAEEPPHPSPWSTVEEEPNPDGEHVARAWLAARDHSPPAARAELEAPGLVIKRDGDDRPPLLSHRETEVDDLLSAGDRIAVRLTIRGEYAGGLAGVDNTAIGARCYLHSTGLLEVTRARVRRVQIVTDRYGLRRRLGRGPLSFTD